MQAIETTGNGFRTLVRKKQEQTKASDDPDHSNFILLSNLMVAVLGLDKNAQQLLLTQAKGYYMILDKTGSTSQARAGFEKYY